MNINRIDQRAAATQGTYEVFYQTGAGSVVLADDLDGHAAAAMVRACRLAFRCGRQAEGAVRAAALRGLLDGEVA